MKVLCQVAPWSENYFKDVVKNIGVDTEIKNISGFKKLDKTKLMEVYECELKKTWIDKRYKETIEETKEIEEIICRCRLLRNLDHEYSTKHVLALQRSIRIIYNDENPDVIIAELIDSYFQDIIIREALKRNIKCYTFVQNFINGYSRMTIRGELNPSSNPSSSEVEDVLDRIIDKNYKPNYVIKKNQKLLISQLTAFSGNIARVLYFYTLRIITREKYNYHYWVSSVSIRKINLHFWPKTIKANEKWRKIVENSELKVIFVPLQYSPEATIDYWCEHIEHINYEKSISAYIEKLSEDFIVLIKEHPAVVGHRNPKFYDEIINKKNTNVIVCPTNENSNECILKSNAVFIYTGTVGFESALNGTPVLTPENPYFMSGRFFKKINLNTDNNEIKNYIKMIEGNKIQKNEQLDMISNLLRGLIDVQLILDGSYDKNIKYHNESAIKLGNKIKELIG